MPLFCPGLFPSSKRPAVSAAISSSIWERSPNDTSRDVSFDPPVMQECHSGNSDLQDSPDKRPQRKVGSANRKGAFLVSDTPFAVGGYQRHMSRMETFEKADQNSNTEEKQVHPVGHLAERVAFFVSVSLSP